MILFAKIWLRTLLAVFITIFAIILYKGYPYSVVWSLIGPVVPYVIMGTVLAVEVLFP